MVNIKFNHRHEHISFLSLTHTHPTSNTWWSYLSEELRSPRHDVYTVCCCRKNNSIRLHSISSQCPAPPLCPRQHLQKRLQNASPPPPPLITRSPRGTAQHTARDKVADVPRKDKTRVQRLLVDQGGLRGHLPCANRRRIDGFGRARGRQACTHTHTFAGKGNCCGFI